MNCFPWACNGYKSLLIIYTKYHDLAGRSVFPKSEKVIFLDEWNEVLKMLEGDYPSYANVAVYPYAEMQYTVWADSIVDGRLLTANTIGIRIDEL